MNSNGGGDPNSFNHLASLVITKYSLAVVNYFSPLSIKAQYDSGLVDTLWLAEHSASQGFVPSTSLHQ